MKKYRAMAAILLCLAAVTFLTADALAVGSIELAREHSLTVTAVYGAEAISGMRFDAYLISTVDESGELTVGDRYRDYADDLDIRGENDERWRAMTQVLAREIMLDNALSPSCSAVTDASGAAVFADIPMGLYLIMGHGVQRGGFVYTVTPFLAIVPERDLLGDDWNYAVVANAKPGREPVRTDYEVVKVWKDDCHKDQRPQSITISLICDGEVYDAIALPHDGAWSYTWRDLETNHQWTVTENKADGYQDPDVRREGNTFIVTNTCSKPTAPLQPGTPTLPQTGQLWWPVPVLICAGLLFVVIGLLRRRGTAQEE